MKKHDEGYALVLVLIVLTVLGLLASLMLSFSLQHVQTQQKYIDRMQDQYAAAGEIEAIIGQMQSTGTCSIPEEFVIEPLIPGELHLTVPGDYVRIDCKLQITGVVSGPTDGKYTVSGVTEVQYISYEISNTGGGA